MNPVSDPEDPARRASERSGPEPAAPEPAASDPTTLEPAAPVPPAPEPTVPEPAAAVPPASAPPAPVPPAPEPADPQYRGPESRASELSDWDVDARSAVELLLGALAGSALLPFLQAIATKAGEDVYGKIRDKLSRRDRKKTKDQLNTSGTVTISDPDSQLILQFPSTMTESMTTRLENLRVPVVRDTWFLVSWNPAQAEWQWQPCDPPAPENVVQAAP